MVIDFITTPIWKALKAEISRATGEEQDIRETSVADANYDSSGKTIDFYNVFGDEIASIDATAFIKDGMVDSVSLSGNILTITFNTDAGKQAINIDLTDFIDPTNYYNKFEVDGIISGVNAHIEDVEDVTSIALNELHNDKQDLLVSGSNIKTINNLSLLGSGNIDIQGGGSESYSAGTNIDITNNVISVVGMPTKTSELTNDSGFITSASLPTKTSDLTNDSGFITSASLPTKTSDLTNDSGFITSSDTRNFVNSGQVQTQINNSISGYATTAFTEATYLKEHQSLSAYSTTQQMNVAISNAVADKVASNDVDNIVKISQADYDALSAYTSTTLYLIPE